MEAEVKQIGRRDDGRGDDKNIEKYIEQ